MFSGTSTQVNSRPASQSRPSHTSINDDEGWEHHRRSAMYRRESNLSQASFMTEHVEMAQDEMFSGPMSESVPTATSAFSHRRSRADSNASFAFYDDEQDENFDNEDAFPEEAIMDEEYEQDEQDGHERRTRGSVGCLGAEDTFLEPELNDEDTRNGDRPSFASSRKISGLSRSSKGSRSSRRTSANSAKPLLRRHTSTGSDNSGFGRGARTNQKIYIVTEDMTIVVAGFKTSLLGYALYLCLCILTGGIGYLLMRWLPKWYVRVVGKATPLGRCDWVVIENLWGEMILQDLSKQEFGHSLSAVFGFNEKSKFREYDEYDDPIMDELRILDYRYIRFCYHPVKDKFVLGNTWKDPSWTDVAAVREGIDTEEAENRERIFGTNEIDIKQKTTGQLLMDEAFHPFYVFQIASLVLWSADEYYYYAGCIFLISAVSIGTTLVETKATMKRLRDISRFECDIRVLRGGFWRYVESSELVPGDVYEVTDPNLGQFPCDSLLLSGDCIVNESMLTGESVPVSKTPASDETLELLNLSSSAMHPEVAKHMLFSGTKIIRARRPQDDKSDEAAALALVVRTGFNTTKGALVRSILFPKPSGFKFYRDSFRYISVMACIAAVGFVASLFNFIRLGLHPGLIIVRALDLITIVVPPALPATLTIGTNFALQRLKSKLIFCISPQRVNVGGKIDVMCFDKTGTLTEDGLDVLGVRVVSRPANRYSDLLTDSTSLLPGGQYERDPTIDYNANKAILYTMATCHSLRIVDGEFIGDPLDLKMFEFTRWQFEEGSERPAAGEDEEDKSLTPSVARPPPGMEFDLDEEEHSPNSRRPIELGVLKAFEFVSQLRRASVIVRQFGEKSGDVYVKGAPEAMRDICKPESFPPDYEELLAYYTHRGFRVIACATKHIFKLNWLKVQKMKREEAESGLDFVGFIIFENKLKERTTGVIEELAEANIRTVMCTGDNILTAISVARECSLIDRSAHCFVPHFAEGDSRNPLSRLVWESVDNPVYTLDENTLKPLPPPADHDSSLPYDVSNLRNYSVAVSGDVFRWLVDFASPKVLANMLVVGQVFARMSPDEKHELVEKLQSIDYCAGFCGDGANDCGALKAADVGISLSEAEASVAAPFTSRVFDISCVPEVIREGRAALVTSFSCFKYMSLYSAIQFTSVSFLYATASNLGDFQFLFIDLLLILPIAIFMGWSGPYPELAKKRPTASLVSRKVLTPLLGQIALCVITQLIGWLVVRQQPWYQPPVLDKGHSNSTNSENSTLFLLSCYQYILSAVVLSVGKPFRQSMAHNLPFVITLLVDLAITSYMLFDPAPWLYSLMNLTWMSQSFRIFILVLGVGAFSVSYFAERLVFPRLAKWVGSFNQRVRRIEKKHALIETVVDGGYLPEFLLRQGIRGQLRERINIIKTTSLSDSYETKMKYVDLLRTRPIAIETAAANQQHYEVGTGVLSACLGPRMKYSCCLYPKGTETLAQAEIAMLESYVEKAQLKDGMSIFDLGCGWGSLSLYLAEIFPNSKITALSNSKTQKQYIDASASSKGFSNLQVVTADIATNSFAGSELEGAFDRVLSIELFEHMKNYELLLAKVSTLLKPEGKLFVHLFAHKDTPYDFETGWMTEHFFTGGTMPSADLMLYFQRDLRVTQQWWVSGKHYAKTSNDWLSKMNAEKKTLWPHLEETYGKSEALRWFHRWQVFYMACAELFDFAGGDTWGVCHYLFEKPAQ
ncbi:hypothetical protein LTR97_001791 [Elasticomyces elasticus]|uniref:Cation-transporting ATPase n=1 Tax=Elasticomyces elasticus TaxID=574655 RepID=A0AAN7WC53_9PEZI|nr:hypothetical protein LTR97_001791 [Elasticomyces elasticus]